MLSPTRIETAGDAVASIYNNMEAQMLDHLVETLLSVDRLDQRTFTELNLISQSQTAALRRVVEDNRGLIASEVYATCERLLEASDEDDMRRMGSEGEPIWPQQLVATAAGLQAICDRDNLLMVEGAKRQFLEASMNAVTMVNSGLYTTERALHIAVRKLEEGVPIITYRNTKTGVQTVQNKVDVAVRRHIRTQIAQDGARMTLQRLDKLEVALVEVSSHCKCRPTHEAWQGRCFSLNGEVEIDGVRYPDFYSSTGYGHVDGLLGANCRHSFGPYRHGAPHAYDPEPKHPSGLPNDEIYDMEQKQRYLERCIRDCKRDLRGAQLLYEKDQSISSKTALIKTQERLQKRQAQMRDFIKESNAKSKTPSVKILHRHPNREWAGDMPKGVKVAASHRKLDDFLASRSKQLKTAGISKAKMKAAIAGEMAKRGGTSADFASLSAGDQQSIFNKIKSSIDTKLPSTRKANAGKHVDRIAGVVRGEPMSFEKADGRRVNPGFMTGRGGYFTNCQSCVVAFEARMRGYDVEAMPYGKHGIAKEVARETWVAWRDPATGEVPAPNTLNGMNTPNRLMSYLEENIKEGERYTFNYDVRNGDWRHIIFLDRTPEGMRLYDPQSGEQFTGVEYRNYLRQKIKYKGTEYGMKVEYPVDLLRVDNLDFNLPVVNQIVKGKS